MNICGSFCNPTLTVAVSGNAANGYQLTNRADAGGKYQGTWVTVIQRLTPTVTPQTSQDWLLS